MGFIKVGAIWNPKEGKTALSGQIELSKLTQQQGDKIRFFVFENKKKTPGSNQPDFDVVISDGEAHTAAPRGNINESDIPF